MTQAANNRVFDQVKAVYNLWYRAIHKGEYLLYFEYFAFTVDEHDPNPSRDLKPLISDKADREWIVPILEEVFKDDYRILFLVKSRQQRATWIFSHIDIYKGMANRNFLTLLQSTKKINKAEELLRKHHVCLSKLPSWASSYKIYDRDSKVKIGNGSRYVALSEEVDDAASMTYNAFYFDEMSLHAKARKVFGICLAGLGLAHEGGGVFYATSSPRQGSYMVELAIDEFMEETRRWIVRRKWSNNGLSVGFNRRGHKVMFLHYSANRFKDARWKESEAKNYDPDVWEREFELNPDAVEGSKVFRVFNIKMVKKDIPLQHDIPLIRGWDFGRKSAVVFLQYNNRLKLLTILRNILQEYSDAESLVVETNEVTNEILSTCRGFGSYILDYCDPFSGPRETFISGSSEIFEVEQKMKAICNKKMRARSARRVSIETAIAIVRAVIRQGMEIDDRCDTLVKGFRGGYVLRQRKAEPVKDGHYEHVFDALKYPLVTLFNIIPTKGLIYIPQLSRYLSYPDAYVRDERIEGVNINSLYPKRA